MKNALAETSQQPAFFAKLCFKVLIGTFFSFEMIFREFIQIRVFSTFFIL